MLTTTLGAPARLHFPGCPSPSLGVELELSLVDRASGDLAARAPEVIAALADPAFVKPELFPSIVEINSRACPNVASLEQDLGQRLRQLATVLAPLGLGCFGAGAHPCADWRHLAVTDDERYRRLVERLRWPAERLLISGTHLHVGVPDGDAAVALLRPLSFYLPHFLALSASSPYWLGRDTGLDSARTVVFGGLPSTGLPPAVDGWADFADLFSALQASGIAESIRDVWWDIRPHTSFGTLELRICDSINDLPTLCTLAALLQALVAELLAQHAAGVRLWRPPAWLLNENKWRAARYGLEAQIIVTADGRQQPLADHLRALAARLAPQAQALGGAPALAQLEPLLRRGNGASGQRRAVAAAGGQPAAAVAHLLQAFDPGV